MPYNVKGECRNTGRTHFKKGFTPWNKGKTGYLSEEAKFRMGSPFRGKSTPMKGRHHSEEIKERIRRQIHIILIGNTRTKDKPWSEIRRKKGNPPWSEERRKAYRAKFPKRPIIKNGKEYSPQWNEIRKKIYKRDDWKCQLCGIKCVDAHRKKLTKRTIQCHHIDYNEKNNDFSNLITLCASCHLKTLFRREDWIDYFSRKIRKDW